MFPIDVTSKLDMLAREGVLNYDAASYIAGTEPRYYNYPMGTITQPVPTVINNSNQTPKDTFNGKQLGNATKALVGAGVIVGGGLLLIASVLAGIKGLKIPKFSNILSSIKNKLPSISGIKNTCNNWWHKAINTIKRKP